MVCQDLGQLNLPVMVSTPEQFTENLFDNTAWLARLYFLAPFLGCADRNWWIQPAQVLTHYLGIWPCIKNPM